MINDKIMDEISHAYDTHQEFWHNVCKTHDELTHQPQMFSAEVDSIFKIDSQCRKMLNEIGQAGNNTG